MADETILEFDEASISFSDDLLYSIEKGLVGGDRKITQKNLLSQGKYIQARLIGNNLNLSSIGVGMISVLTGTDIAYITPVSSPAGSSDLKTYRFDGTNWSQVGSTLNITSFVVAQIDGLCSLTSTDICIVTSTWLLYVYRFNGSTWSQVGSTTNIDPGVTRAELVSMTALNSTDIVIIDSGDKNLEVWRFNGSTFSQVGNSLNISSMSSPAITALNSTDIAFIDTTNEDLRVYRWDGSDFTQIGNDLNISGIGTPCISALNGMDIVLIDFTNQTLQVYRFDGDDWVQISDDTVLGSASTGNPSMCSLNGVDVAYHDSGTQNLRKYRFDTFYKYPYSPVDPDF